MNPHLLKQMTWGDVKEIVETALSTPFHEPTPEVECYMEILRVLRARNNAIPPVSERYAKVKEAAEIATGTKLGRSRERWNMLLRYFISHQLRREGYQLTEIGREMGRDHTSVSHQIQRMDWMLSLPNAYKYEVGLHKRFLEVLGGG